MKALFSAFALLPTVALFRALNAHPEPAGETPVGPSISIEAQPRGAFAGGARTEALEPEDSNAFPHVVDADLPPR